MIRAAVLVPRRDNEGKPFPLRLRRELEGRLLDLSGGLSLTMGIRGVWRSSDQIYRDIIDRYEVWLPS